MSQEIITKELQPIANEALELKIKSHGDMLVATDLLSRLNKISDRIKEEKEKVTKPLNEALKAERARWKPLEGFYGDAIEHIREGMSDYQTKLIEKQSEVADSVSRGTLSIEKGIEKIEEIGLDKNVVTDNGSIAFRETQIAGITNEKLIPRKYLVVDEKHLLEDLKAGIEIPGAELFVKQVPINHRK